MQNFQHQSIAKNRIVYKGAIYHVTQRAPGNEIIFVDENDRLYFLKTLKEAAVIFKLKVFAFALLTNHIHLLLQITEKNLSVAMKYLFECYAKYFNKKYKRKGHVFCGRFRAQLCQDDAHIMTTSVYIHLNPLRAGLCDDIKNYRWTSVHLYLNQNKATFINFEKILTFLNTDLDKARQQYFQLLGQAKKSTCDIEKTGADFIPKIEDQLKSLINTLKLKARITSKEDREKRELVIEQLETRGLSSSEIQSILCINRVTLYRIRKNASNATK